MLPPPVQAYFAAHSQHDPRLLDGVLADDAVGRVNGRELRGAAALREEVASLAAAFPDGVWSVQDGVREADRVAVRWELAGRHLGPLRGRPATGRTVRAGGLTLFRIHEGRIYELWTSWDAEALGGR